MMTDERQTTVHTYTFSNASNSYFMGNDVRVTRDDGRTVKINGKDGMCAIEVKRYSFDIPDEVEDLAADLNKSNANRMGDYPYPGADYTELLYAHEQEGWWEDAEWLARERDFDGVYSAGRSGGWCCIDGTDTDWWPNAIMFPDPLPQPSEDEQYLAEEKWQARNRFLELAFELHDAIDRRVQMWVERIEDEHAELQREREECIVRGEN